jgi:hypothetical protein
VVLPEINVPEVEMATLPSSPRVVARPLLLAQPISIRMVGDKVFLVRQRVEKAWFWKVRGRFKGWAIYCLDQIFPPIWSALWAGME